jgi:hypothetical protein
LAEAAYIDRPIVPRGALNLGGSVRISTMEPSSEHFEMAALSEPKVQPDAPVAMDSGRRVPVFLRGRRGPVGTVIAPVNSPGPIVETIEVEGITATYWRRHHLQVIYLEFESLAQARRWPSFEPPEGPRDLKDLRRQRSPSIDGA